MPIKVLLLLLATIIFPAVAFSQMAAPHGPCHHFPTDFPWVVNLNGCDCYSMVGRACHEPPILYNEAFCYNETVGEEGRFYCAGGTIRQCDKELTTQTEGPDGPYASECQGGEYCSENGRCDSCKTKKSCNDNKVETTDTCIEGSLYERKKTCGHCEVIKGNSGAATQVTFVASSYVSADELRLVVIAAGEAEPFQTLIKWGNLNFQIASGDQRYTVLPYASNYTLIEQPQEIRQSMTKFGKAVCESSDVVVYVTSEDQVTSSSSRARGAYWEENSLIIAMADFTLLVHELGHALGGLADEYPEDKEMQNGGPNVLEGVEGRFCPPFDKLLSPKNCFYIDKENYPGRRMSRCWSAMSMRNEDRFNIISCAAIMKEVASMGTEQGVEFCKGLVQTGKVLAQDCS